MAKTRSNPSVGSIEGKIGRLVYYNWKGEPHVRRAPERTKPFSEAELKNQWRMKLASTTANGLLKDPVVRARYEAAAEGTRLSAQNVAVSDFMHTPVLTEVDLGGYTGRSREFIKVRAEEGRIGAAAVEVTIADREKVTLEAGRAYVEVDGVTWWYGAQKDLPADQPLWITVTAVDQPGNKVSKTLRHTTGA